MRRIVFAQRNVGVSLRVMRSILRASRHCFMPIVIARRGKFSRLPPTPLWRVESIVRVKSLISRMRGLDFATPGPGSLNATWPWMPMPP